LVRESAIVAPSAMIAVGDPFSRSRVTEQDGLFQPLARWKPWKGRTWADPDQETRSAAAVKIHRGLFNRLFCDGHVEPEDFNRPFVPSDEYLRRWNTDNQPHRDRWQ